MQQLSSRAGDPHVPKQKVPDPLSLACERVGRFLYYFSRVEMQLDDAITQVLKLDPEIAPIVTWNLDFSRKVNIVQCAVTSHNENSPSKKIEMDTFSEVFKVNTDRQTIAHCSFEPEGADAVQFRRATAHKKYKRVDPRWTNQQFEQRYVKVKRFEAKLRKIVS